MGQNNYFGKNVCIGKNCVLGNNISIYDDTIIGNNVRIDDNVVIGKLPLKSINSATTSVSDLKKTIIENNVLIGTSAILYRGVYIGKEVLIADQASIRENVSVGNNTIIGCKATIENNVNIGSYCKIQSNVQIVPYSIIEDYVFIAPGVMTSNDNYVGRTKERFTKFKGVFIKKGARVGVGAIILPGITLFEDCLVGAGSVVTKNVHTKKVVYGIPAKIIKDVLNEQLLKNQ